MQKRLCLLVLAFASCCFGEIQDDLPVKEELEDPSDIGVCTSQAGDIENISPQTSEWMNIFVDVSFKCRGKVTRWDLWAKLRGQIFFTVWRPTPGGNGWNFVGKNLVHIRSRGLQTFYIPDEDQITVQRGDVIGLQYPRDDPEQEKPSERGIVPYQDQYPEDTIEDSDGGFPFTRVITKKLFDDDIDTTRTIRGVRDFKRRAALAAHTDQPGPCVPNPCEKNGLCTPVGDSYECMCNPDEVGQNCEDSVQCELAGGPLENLAYDSGVWLNIFTQFPFSCSGDIVEWRFYAKKMGKMYLSAWRSSKSGWELLGKNLIDVPRPGLHRVTIANRNQITVEAGDVMGIHYPDNAVNKDNGRGIIPYVDTRVGGAGLCCGVQQRHLSEIYNVNIQDTAIETNPFQSGNEHIRDFKRAVALSALVSGEMCGLQLGPRRNLSYDSGQWLNVFINRPIKCSGNIVRWELYAKKTGDIFLSVWGGSQKDGFRLKAKSRFTVSSLGSQAIDIAAIKQLAVEPNDVIGIHYPDRKPGEDDRGIIPYENSDEFPNWTSIYRDDAYEEEYKYLKVHNMDVQNSGISADYIAVSPFREFQRYPAIAVYVDEGAGRTQKVM